MFTKKIKPKGIDFGKLYSLDKTAGDLVVESLSAFDRIKDAPDNISIGNGVADIRGLKEAREPFAKMLAEFVDSITEKDKSVKIGQIKLAVSDVISSLAFLGFNTVSNTRGNIGNTLNNSMEFSPEALDMTALMKKIESITMTFKVNFK